MILFFFANACRKIVENVVSDGKKVKSAKFRGNEGDTEIANETDERTVKLPRPKTCTLASNFFEFKH